MMFCISIWGLSSGLHKGGFPPLSPPTKSRTRTFTNVCASRCAFTLWWKPDREIWVAERRGVWNAAEAQDQIAQFQGVHFYPESGGLFKTKGVQEAEINLLMDLSQWRVINLQHCSATRRWFHETWPYKKSCYDPWQHFSFSVNGIFSLIYTDL